MLFEIVYRKEGYQLSDAFRPNPFWGKRIFRVDGDKLETNNIESIREAAIATPPPGYEFFSIEQCGSGKRLYAPAIPASNKEQA